MKEKMPRLIQQVLDDFKKDPNPFERGNPPPPPPPNPVPDR